MVLIEEDCSLCGVTYPYRVLRRCQRCGRLYCRNCFLYDEEGKIVCLRCVKRRITPKASGGKYTGLSTYLAWKAQWRDQVTLPFAKIEEIIEDQLPFSAHHYKHWWSNVRSRSPSEAWLTAGWSVTDVDLERGTVTFRKDAENPVKAPKKRLRRKPVSKAFKALALKRRPKMRSEPSKTKIAKVQARLLNIERNKASAREYRGKFKPKSAHEKRLYESSEKPD